MMKQKLGIIISLAMVLTFSYSCDNKSQKKAGEGKVLAKVNQAEIYDAQLKREAMTKAHTAKAKDPEEQKKEFLDDLIGDEVLFQEAIKENYHRKEGVKRQIVRQFLNDKMKSKFNFTDAELQAYYDSHIDELQRIRASHILLKPEKKNDPAAMAKALEKAKAILKKLKAGEDFAELAKTHSQDPGSGRRGGDLRFFNKRMMVKPFSEAAFALKEIGDISDIVETDFGYHIIKLTGRQEGIEPLRHIIKANLMKEKRETAQAEIIASLRKAAKVTVYDKNLANVELTSQKPASNQSPHQKMDPEKLKELMEKMKASQGAQPKPAK